VHKKCHGEAVSCDDFLFYRYANTHRPIDVDAVTYDIIGNQGPDYEVIKKGKRDDVKSPPTKTGEFTLNQCPAYGPVSTPASQREQYGEHSTEYESLQTTSSM
jgi:hypothetical protein